MPMSKPLRFCTHSLALACTALLLAACQTTQAPATTAVVQQTSAQASLAQRPQLRQDAFSGVYEIAAAADGEVLYVADITGFDGNNAGFIHRLDARTLQTLQTTQVPRRSFALGLNNATQTLYAGNTMEGSLSVVDLATGMLKAQIQLAEPITNAKGETAYAHTRKVIVDEAHNRVFVTSPGRPGLIWIVDGATNTLQHTITSDGIWSAGAAYDAKANRLYVGQGGQNEVLVIDPDTGSVVQRLSTGEMTPEHKDRSANFFINIALDANKQRLFAAGGQKNQVYVWDLASGKVVDRIPFESGTLDIVFNPARNEIVTSHRGDDKTGSGFVAILDADSYALKRRLDLPVHPNSLALSPNGQTLYVTVKAPHADKHPAYRKDAKDSVVRIDLNQP